MSNTWQNCQSLPIAATWQFRTVTVDRCNVNEETINTLLFVKESIRFAVIGQELTFMRLVNYIKSAHVMHIPDIKHILWKEYWRGEEEAERKGCSHKCQLEDSSKVKEKELNEKSQYCAVWNQNQHGRRWEMWGRLPLVETWKLEDVSTANKRSCRKAVCRNKKSRHGSNISCTCHSQIRWTTLICGQLRYWWTQ